MAFHKWIWYVWFLLLLMACSETITEETLILKGQIKGRVTLYNEFLEHETDQSGTTLTLDGSAGPLSAVTDAEGRYLFTDVPTGTYHLVIEKPGFPSYKHKGLRVMGGKEPLYTFYQLIHNSTASFEDLRLSFSPQSVSFTGVVVHQHPSPYPLLWLVAFFGTNADVSPQNHLESISHIVREASGTEITFHADVDPALFPSGSTLYAVVHGYSAGRTFNPETGFNEYYGLGEPSEIASISIP